MRRVVVHIEQLVLEGFQARDRHSIGVGLQQELGRVFADPQVVAILAARGGMPQMQVGGVSLDHGSKPQRMGESVGRGIGKELKR